MQTTTALPYPSDALNKFYAMLFCDDRSPFSTQAVDKREYPWSILLESQPAVLQLQAVANDDSLESRQRLLAFRLLQQAGQPVPRKTLLGVVVELGLEGGLDTLAAYRDGSARYINQSGKVIVWDAPEETSRRLIHELFLQSEEVVKRIGPWTGARPDAPGTGIMRLSFLVSDGLYFGQGPYAVLQRDAMAAPVVDAATQLMLFLVDRASAKKG